MSSGGFSTGAVTPDMCRLAFGPGGLVSCADGPDRNFYGAAARNFYGVGQIVHLVETHKPESFSSKLFDAATDLRNEKSTYNGEYATFFTFAVTLLSEMTYALLPLVGVIEGIFLASVALGAKIASFCMREGPSKDWALAATDLKDDALSAIKTSVASIGALVFNFTREKFDLKEAFEGTLPCYADRA